MTTKAKKNFLLNCLTDFYTMFSKKSMIVTMTVRSLILVCWKKCCSRLDMKAGSWSQIICIGEAKCFIYPFKMAAQISTVYDVFKDNAMRKVVSSQRRTRMYLYLFP